MQTARCVRSGATVSAALGRQLRPIHARRPKRLGVRQEVPGPLLRVARAHRLTASPRAATLDTLRREPEVLTLIAWRAQLEVIALAGLLAVQRSKQ